MPAPVRTIEPEALEESAWEPFGWLPVADTDPRDGRRRLEFIWDDVHVNIIGHRRDEVPEAPDRLRCDMLYRHDTHTQTIMPLDHDAVIAVAPAGVDFSRPEDAAAIRVFLLHPQDNFVLNRGTWHWGPFPTHAEVVSLFNVQGLRYAEDNTMVDLEAKGLSVDVLVGAA
jgi:ureidoglycolate hydrolase